MTTNTPRTYTAAAAIAETVTLAELTEMIAADNNPDIFPGKGKDRHIAMDTTLQSCGKYGSVFYNRCNRNGYTVEEIVTVGVRYNPSVLHFTSTGRTVKVTG